MKAMEDAAPTHEPGAVIAYHPFNFGWVIAELVRRLDGRPFSQFLGDELTGPLGMADTYVGLPPSLEGRVSRVHPMEELGARSQFVDNINRPEVHQAVVPAACGIGTARDLARFFAMLERGGTLDGVQILKPETVAEATALQVEGMDITLQQYHHRCLGMVLADPRTGAPGSVGIHTFGHGAAGAAIAWGDSDSGLAVAFIANGFRHNQWDNSSLSAICQAVRDACR